MNGSDNPLSLLARSIGRAIARQHYLEYKRMYGNSPSTRLNTAKSLSCSKIKDKTKRKDSSVV